MSPCLLGLLFWQSYGYYMKENGIWLPPLLYIYNGMLMTICLDFLPLQLRAISLFINEKYKFNEMFQQYSPTLAIFYVLEIPCIFIVFRYVCFLIIFTLWMLGSMSNNSPGHSQGKNVKLGIMKNKTKKYLGFFLISTYIK